MDGVDALVSRVRRLRPAGRRLTIGVAGAPGAGKTTLALALVRALAGRADWRDSAVAHVPMDGFHLADAELDRLGLREVKGVPASFDPLGYAALLTRARDGEECWAPGFDRAQEQPLAQALPVTAAARVVVGEGNYLLLDTPPWPAVRACFDEVWFCRLDPAVRRERLVARHIRFGKTPAAAREWVFRVDEANAALVANGADRADLVLDLS